MTSSKHFLVFLSFTNVVGGHFLSFFSGIGRRNQWSVKLEENGNNKSVLPVSLSLDFLNACPGMKKHFFFPLECSLCHHSFFIGRLLLANFEVSGSFGDGNNHPSSSVRRMVRNIKS